ncbi:hypothetical protein DERP_013620 [Dermatophagoides pteronyssinus]|uniref:Uncharacterized protein n=1 Tax=Dermatophagoides pteronyssinus TaxID=6956 RepID=A0ABQ8IQ12_DERPT|nr:hypothetical protein DERP_013620 [Dermatophagoides pteronyssinus]
MKYHQDKYQQTNDDNVVSTLTPKSSSTNEIDVSFPHRSSPYIVYINPLGTVLNDRASEACSIIEGKLFILYGLNM